MNPILRTIKDPTINPVHSICCCKGVKKAEWIVFKGFDDGEHNVAGAREIRFFARFFNSYIRAHDHQGKVIYISKKSLEDKFCNTDRERSIVDQYIPGKELFRVIAPLQRSLSTENINDILKHSRKVKDSIFISKRVHGLARSILLTPEGNYLLLTSSKRCGDPVIGEGAFKKVKYAINLDTKETRAVGIIRKKGHTEESWSDIKNEIDLMKQFKGKEAIVQLATAFIKSTNDGKDDKAYIVMDHCELGDLFDHFEKRNLTRSDRVQIAIDCATGLKDQHDEGILNRDVKPDNVLLYRKGGRIRAKMADLGCACKEEEDQRLGRFVGTQAYLSPEKIKAALAQWDPKKKLRASTTRAGDIWAMGLVFYALFNKNHGSWSFFDGPLKKIASLTRPAMDDEILDSNIPDEFTPLIVGMLQCDPSERWTTNKVLQELDRLKI
jgi:hypothetical protein